MYSCGKTWHFLLHPSWERFKYPNLWAKKTVKYPWVFRVKMLKSRVGRHITKCKAALRIIGPGSSAWVGSMDWAQGGLYFNNRRPIFPLRQEQARLVGRLSHGTQTKLVYFIFTSFQKTHSLWPFLWWKRTSGQNPNQIRKLVWTLRSTPGLPCHYRKYVLEYLYICRQCPFPITCKVHGCANVVEPDPAWRSGGTTLQGHSIQQFTKAEPIRVDHSRRVELVLRLVAR